MTRPFEPIATRSVSGAATAVAILAIALAATACGAGTATPTATQVATSHLSAPTATPSVTTPASPRTSVSPPNANPIASELPKPAASGVTLLEQGCRPNEARCHDMAAGTYETSGTWAFLRGLTVTLPAGWSSNEQDAGEFELHEATDAGEANQIYFWRDLVAWVDGEPKPELGTSADELADYLLSDPRISVVEGPRRTFNVRELDSVRVASTVEARSFSVIVADATQTAPGTFTDCPDEACIGILSDVPHWDGDAPSLTRGNDEGASQALRVYIASIGHELHPHTLFVVLSTYGTDPLDSLAAWEGQVEPIVASVLVAPIVVDN